MTPPISHISIYDYITIEFIIHFLLSSLHGELLFIKMIKFKRNKLLVLYWLVRCWGSNARRSCSECRNEYIDDGDHENQSDRPMIDQIHHSSPPLKISRDWSCRIRSSISIDGRDRFSLDIRAGNQYNTSNDLYINNSIINILYTSNEKFSYLIFYL